MIFPLVTLKIPKNFQKFTVSNLDRSYLSIFPAIKKKTIY